MHTHAPDWDLIRTRAAAFPEAAFVFAHDVFVHTTMLLHGGQADSEVGDGADTRGGGPASPEARDAGTLSQPSRHVSGPQLCMGMVDLARQRYGRMARFVLSRWGVRSTFDFGVLVYGLIDRGDLRCAQDDHIDDFRDVCDLEEALASERDDEPRVAARPERGHLPDADHA